MIQKWKLDFSITKPCRYEFLIKSGYYIVPSPSTALEQQERGFTHNLTDLINTFSLTNLVN